MGKKKKKKKKNLYSFIQQIRGCGHKWADLYRGPVEDHIHQGEEDLFDAFKLVGDMELRRK